MLEALRNDWRWVVGVVSGCHFFSHFYNLALPPLFPLLRTEFGLSNAELGLIVSVTMIGGLLQAPVGSIVDRVGAKRILVAGLGVTAGGIMLIGLGPTYLVILGLAVVTGLGQAVFHPADYALLDTITDADHQGRAFSIHTFSGYAGSATAPAVVGYVALTSNWRVALFVVGGVGLLYAALATVALVPAYRDTIDAQNARADSDTDPAPERSFFSTLLQPGILAMIGFFVLNAFAGKGLQTFTPVLSIDVFEFSASVGNTLLTAYFAFGAVGVLVGGVLTDRFAPGRIIAASLSTGAALILLAVSGIVSFGVVSLVGLFGLIGFFASLVSPSRDQLVSDLSDEGSMGKSFGIVFTGGATGALIGPALLGVVGDVTSITSAFVLVAVFFLVAGGLALSLGRGWLTGAPGPEAAGGD